MFTLTEVERNCTGLHSDATKLFIFSAIKIAQLFSQSTPQTCQPKHNYMITSIPWAGRLSWLENATQVQFFDGRF